MTGGVLTVTARKEGAAVVVSPSGRLDGAGAPVLEAELSAIARRGGGRVVLDGRGIVYISSAGLRAYLIGAKICVQEGGALAIAPIRPDCRAVMEASGLLSILGCHETVEAALAAGARGQRTPADGPDVEIGERHEGRIDARMGSGTPNCSPPIGIRSGRGRIVSASCGRTECEPGTAQRPIRQCKVCCRDRTGLKE